MRFSPTFGELGRPAPKVYEKANLVVVMRRTRETLLTSTGVDGDEDEDTDDEPLEVDEAREDSSGELMEQCGGGEKRNVYKSSPMTADVCLFRGPGELIIGNVFQ